MTSAVVYISPSTLACPNNYGCEEEFRNDLEKYILQLSAVRDSMGSNLFQVMISRGIGDLLIEAGCYPVFPSVRQGLIESSLNHVYQAGDVVKVVEQILRESDVVEDAVGVLDILTDSVSVEGPVEYIGDGYIVERQNQNKVTLALGAHLGIIPDKSVCIIGGKNDDKCGDLRVKAKIVDADWLKIPDFFNFPVEIDKSFNFLGSFDQVRRNVDPSKAIQTVPPGIISEIISCALTQKEYAQGGEQRIDWNIGPAFEKSILDLHLHNNAPAFRALVLACVNVICEIAQDKTHPLRTGSGGNNPQVVDGSSSAWRRDINYEFHLHYWTKGRTCEFASCVVHEDFSIPPPGK